MTTLVSLRGQRSFYLESGRVRQQPAEAELARVTYREGIFEVELVVKVKLYYWWEPALHEVEIGDDMVQHVLTARKLVSSASLQEPEAMMFIQRPWRLTSSLDSQAQRHQWLTEWCEEAIFLGLLREDAWETRWILKPVLQKISQGSNFIEEVLREARAERLCFAPNSRSALRG